MIFKMVTNIRDSDDDDDDDNCGDKKTSCGRRGFSLQILIFFHNFVMEGLFVWVELFKLVCDPHAQVSK